MKARSKKVRYEEGCAFLVPLRTSGFARGVLARSDGEGRMFAYFFGPTLPAQNAATVDDLRPDRAILIGMCGDLGLLKGDWPIFGRVPKWSRAQWRLPPLYRVEESSRKAWLSYYDDDTLDFVRQEPVDSNAKDQYPYDRLMGYGAAEIRLTNLLEQSDPIGSG